MINKTQWNIRRGQLADADSLAKFAARTFRESFGTDNTVENMRAHLEKSFGPAQQTQELSDPMVITLLAHRAEQLLGFAQVRRGVAPGCVEHPEPVELHRFYTDRSVHGQGLAQALMSSVMRAAAELDGQHLWLGVWEHNSRAIGFYNKMGFRDVGSTEFVVGADPQRDRILVASLGSVEDTSSGQ